MLGKGESCGCVTMIEESISNRIFSHLIENHIKETKLTITRNTKRESLEETK